MAIAIKAENISKQYRLGYVGSGSLKDDASRWWARMRGKEDPLLKIGSTNDRSQKADSDYVWALKDINFEVQHGDVLGIIGRNGAGKSTLLKILSKTTAPTTGSVKVKGRIASLLEVGTGFHGELTGRENIYLNGAIMGMRKHEITRKLDEIVDFAGVERYLDTPVKRYSSGMYVRLGFAVAAHLENEILIVDEVLAVGDAEFQKKCLGKLGDVSKGEGRTVLFVSHNMQSISTLTSKAILLSEGRLYANGNTSEILDMYSHSFRTNDLIYTSSQDNSNPHIKSVELITTYPNNVQKNGDLMKVVVVLYTPFPIKNACFAFHFVNVMDIHQTNCWVFDSDQPFCRESGYTTLICEIPSLKLFMGKFYLKCYFSEPLGGRTFSIVDNICPFEVTMFNISRTEFPWHPDECTYIEKFNWTIQ